MANQIEVMAKRLSIEPQELNDIVVKTIMPGKVQVSNEQFVSFMAVANEYKLNPLVKEIYAFPAKGGGIQPIVSIDGWLKIITNHPDFDGMEFKDNLDDKGKLISITCSIHRKSMNRPITATEYLDECIRPTDPWKQWPRRMLRHKATIQCGRYAFSISGIIEPDEADRYKEQGVIKDITPTEKHNVLQAAASGVDPAWLRDVLQDILNAPHPGAVTEIYTKAMVECGKFEDREAAKKIQEECKKQQKYFDELEEQVNES